MILGDWIWQFTMPCLMANTCLWKNMWKAKANHNNKGQLIKLPFIVIAVCDLLKKSCY